MMTVNEFLDMCCDRGLLKVTLYDTTNEKDIWSGQGDELPDSMGDMTVESFDVPSTPDCMVLNISGEDC